MTDIAWQWRDSSSGPGVMQRVLVTAEGRYQAAYRAHLAHMYECAGCAGERRCDDGMVLRQAWLDSRGVVR